MITKSYVYKLLLIIFIFLGAFLRLYNLGSAPPSLNWDEAALGYNAYSVLQTGKDEYGKFLPIFTRSFDEYKSMTPVYLIIPSIKIFGLSDFSVRLPSALLGTVSILLIYLICRKLFKDENISLTSAFFFAIEPWAVHLSRVNYESNIALFFLLLGFLLFLSKDSLLPLSMLSFGISMFSYNANKIIIPIIVICFFFLNKKRFKINSIVIFLISILILIFFAFKGEAFARVTHTNIFILWKDMISPKTYYFLWEVVGRYLGYFSPPNLFLREPLEPATIVAGNSIYYPIEFIFWIFGIFFLAKNYHKYKELILVALVSPIPAIMTWNWFQPARVMTLLAIFSIVIGVGATKLLKRKFWVVFLMGLMYAFYLFDSINIYLPVRDKGNYQFGFEETVPAVMKNYDKYDQIIIDSNQAQPYIFYLFYGKYDPKKYLANLDLNYIGTPRKHYDFDKFKFRKINWDIDKNLKNTLFVSDTFPSDAKVISEIKDRSGNIINKLVESNNAK